MMFPCQFCLQGSVGARESRARERVQALPDLQRAHGEGFHGRYSLYTGTTGLSMIIARLVVNVSLTLYWLSSII